MDGLPSDWRVVEPPASAPRSSPGAKPPASESNRIWLAVLGLGLAGLLAGGAWMLAGTSDGAVAVEAAAFEQDAAASASSRPVPSPTPELVVDVGGAVQRPGVYRLADGARVVDAIDAAGGFAPAVDTAAVARDLNLAAPLRDGDRVRVPARGERPDPAGGGDLPERTPAEAADGLVDLNTATASELEALPAIGPATAAKILAAREEQPFASVDDLRTRKILGDSAMAKVRDLVSVR